MDFGTFAGIIGGIATVVAFIATWVKIGTLIGQLEQRVSTVEKKVVTLEMKDQKLSDDLFSVQLKNAEMSARITSDLTWIKKKLDDITKELGKKETDDA